MIKLGIVGYGNLGRGLEAAALEASDFEVVGIFSRRDPAEVSAKSQVYRMDDLKDFKGKIDVLALCGSSDHDIEKQGPALLKDFNTVDCFDTHTHIPAYLDKMEEIGKKSGKLAVISTGRDPGLFSLLRAYAGAILPQANLYTLWGKGLSQGHGAAVRAIEGVKDAVQYTIPKEDFLEAIREGKNPDYSAQKAHRREVFAVLEEGADPQKIEEEIKNLPAYFEGYETEVHFISEEELRENHQGLPHGGRVLGNGACGGGSQANFEFSLDLESNPQFTGQVALAFARACFAMKQKGETGARTVLDIPPRHLSSLSYQDLVEKYV